MVSAIKHIKAVELYHLIVHLKSQAALKTLEELGPVDQRYSTLKVLFANVTLCRNLVHTACISHHFLHLIKYITIL